MKHILITGANGQLGLTFKNIQTKYPNFTFFFATKSILDITNSVEVERFMVANKITTIINCAAYTQVDNAEEDVVLANKINHIAVEDLALLAKKHAITLIHISTDYVFDGDSKVPYTETCKTNPQNEYGRTKLNGELAIQKVNPKNAIIIRTSWLYSEFNTNFVKTIRRISKDKDKIQVVSDQIGSPTYTKDLAEAILNSIPKIKNTTTEIFHYSNKGSCSWFTFAKEIVKISNIKCIVEPIEAINFKTKAKRPKYSLLDTNKIQNTFGIDIPNWQDSLKECICELEKK
jgi:dTDP-4-dehydrorhamnose reductase